MKIYEKEVYRMENELDFNMKKEEKCVSHMLGLYVGYTKQRSSEKGGGGQREKKKEKDKETEKEREKDGKDKSKHRRKQEKRITQDEIERVISYKKHRFKIPSIIGKRASTEKQVIMQEDCYDHLYHQLNNSKGNRKMAAMIQNRPFKEKVNIYSFMLIHL